MSGNGEVLGNCGATPTPIPVVYQSVIPLHLYVATSTVAGAGYDPGTAVLQALAYEVQFTWGDTGAEDATIRNTRCPVSQTFANGLGCHPMGYISLSWTQCDDSVQTAWYSSAYNGGTPTDQNEFMHLQGATHTFANRYYLTKGGSCNPTGGSVNTATTPAPTPTPNNTEVIYPNPANAASNAIWNTVYFTSASYINSNANIWSMLDNESYNRESFSTSAGTTYAQEDEVAQASGHGPATWAQLKAAQFNYFSGYKMVANDYGPGGGGYVNNNKCTASSCPISSAGTGNDGVYNYTIDTADLCSALTGANLMSHVHEKVFASSIGTPAILTGFRDNVKIVVNSDNHSWVDCPNQKIEWLNLKSQSNTDAPAMRYAVLAIRGLAEPNGYTCTRSEKQIVEWQYSTNVNSNTQLGVYPENYLDFCNPSGFGATEAYFKWGTSSVVPGNGTDDSNGCQAGITPSTGGIVDVTIQATCGHDGTDALGYNVGVQAREFSDCREAGVDRGPCAVVINTGGNTVANSYLSAALTRWASYLHIWQYSGSGPQNVDPITGLTVCPNANGCNGAIGLPVSIPVGGIPACGWANMVTSSVCAWVLTSW